MYGLLLPILLILPRLAVASPLQAANSLSLISPTSDTSNTVGFQPIDPRFEVLPHITPVLLDGDQWLVTVVDAMGVVSAKATGAYQRQVTFKNPDPNFHLEIDISSAPPEKQILVQYLVWGFYLAIEGAISLDRFWSCSFILQLEEKFVGSIGVRSSLPGTNLTDKLQQKSSHGGSSDLVIGNLDATDSTDPILLTTPKPKLVITDLGLDLPKYDIVRTIAETLYKTATSNPTDEILDAIIIRPAPFTVELHIIPYARASGKPKMTAEIIAILIHRIPRALLSKGRWAEVHFDIKVGDFNVAHGLLVKPPLKLGPSPNGTSIA